MYLNGPLLGAAWRYAAVAELAIAPSELLASVFAIDFPCLSGAARTASVAANARFRGEAVIRVCRLGPCFNPAMPLFSFLLTRCSCHLLSFFGSEAYPRRSGWRHEAVAGRPIVDFLGGEGSRRILPNWDGGLRRDLTFAVFSWAASAGEQKQPCLFLLSPPPPPRLEAAD